MSHGAAFLILCAVTCCPGATVSGHVQLPAGAEALRSKLTVRLLKSFGQIPDSLGSRWTPTGDFAILDVPPGAYVLWAAGPGIIPTDGNFFGYLSLRVDGSDQRNLVLPLEKVRPVDVTGTIVFDNGAPVQPVFLGLQSSTQRGVGTTSSEDGAFTLKNLLPGHYMIYIGHSPDLPGPGVSGHALSVKFGDKEVLATGFDIDARPPPVMRVTFQPI
jgi:hypothetical protein